MSAGSLGRHSRWFAALAMIALALITTNLRAAADPFQGGCVAYAKGDYEKATTEFERATVERPTAGAWHNLGNADWQCGRPGEAILAWERSLWISPYGANPRANLRFARRVAQLSAPELSWWEICSTWLPVNAWPWVAAVSFWAAVALVTLPSVFRWRKADWHQAVAAGGFAIFLLTIPALIGVHTRTDLGIILAKDTPLRLTPTAEAQTLTKLPAGEMARLETRRGNYVYIRTGNEAAGWVEKSQFGLIAGGDGHSGKGS